MKLEIVKRSDDIKGFKVLPKRWIVERTFGWLIQSRRLVRDYEVKIEHSEAMIYLSMSKRMLARIAHWIFLRQPLALLPRATRKNYIFANQIFYSIYYIFKHISN